MAETSSEPYIGFARRYRSQQFSELVGQDQIAHSLAQQVEQNRVAQAYLFSGPRGVGKTSAARILAKSLNCLEGPTATPCGICDQCIAITAGSSMDVVEIDAASNRKIDDIRNLQESISQHTFSARKKVYIVDEVHMLTNEAFNALLKTLEEPPPFVIFILATTDFEKVPETIRSRCQIFQFNRISIEDLARHLDFIATKESIEMDPGERRAIFETIALAVDGGMRDAVMSLDQLRALGDGAIRLDDAARFLGVVEHDLLIRTVELLQSQDTKALLEMVNYLVERGRDLERYVKHLLGFLRDLMIIKSGGGKDLVNLSSDKIERANALLWTVDDAGRRAEALSYPALLNYLQVFLKLEEQIKEAVQVRIHLEFAFVKLTAIEPVVDIAELIERMDRQGAAPAASPPRAAAAPAAAPPAGMANPATRPAGPPTTNESTPEIFSGGEVSVPKDPKPSAKAPQVPADDAAAIWDAMLSNRQRLGVGISLALNDCQPLGVGSGAFRIGIPKQSLSAPVLQAKDKRSLLEGLILDLTGIAMRVEVQLLAQGNPDGGGPSMGGGSVGNPRVRSGSSDPTPSIFGENSSFESSRSSGVSEPVLREPSAAADDTDLSASDTHALYLAQNADARIRAALKQKGDLRSQVEMVKRFFDGKVLDANGREIAF